MARPRTFIDPSDLAGVIADAQSAVSGVTASTTQTIAGGTVISKAITRISTCANSGDALTLPTAKAGDIRYVFNKGAQTAGIFPYSATEKINALSVGAVYTLAATKGVIFVCAVDGTWDTILTA